MKQKTHLRGPLDLDDETKNRILVGADASNDEDPGLVLDL